MRTNGILLLGLLLLAGCISLYDLTSYVTKGLDTPPVDHVTGSDKLTVSPSVLTFTLTDASKTITATAKDKYVYKDIFLCKNPCRDATHWQKAGEFDEQLIKGRYVDGQKGISKQITVNRGDLNDGNNFVVIFTCAGKGQCNNNKWVMQKFTASFLECPTDCGTKKCDAATQQCVDCLSNADCGNKKCDTTAKKCVDCLIDSDCPTDKKCDSSTKTCITAVSCADKIKNGDETDVDCGGTTCQKCAIDKGCTVDGDCATTKCYTTTKTCVACLADADCGTNKKCDTAIHTCVDKCQGVSCSGSTPKCNPAAGACVGCLVDNDCGAGKKRCISTNTCVDDLGTCGAASLFKCQGQNVLVCDIKPGVYPGVLYVSKTCKDNEVCDDQFSNSCVSCPPGEKKQCLSSGRAPNSFYRSSIVDCTGIRPVLTYCRYGCVITRDSTGKLVDVVCSGLPR